MDVDCPLGATVVEASWAPVPRHGTFSGERAHELWLQRIVQRFGNVHGFAYSDLPPDFFCPDTLGAGWETNDFSPRPRHQGGQGGWFYYTRACISVGFYPDPSGRGWGCCHGRQLDLFDYYCRVCVRAAVQLWWHTYSDAWHHFLVTHKPDYAECVAWLDDKEVEVDFLNSDSRV